MSKMGFFSKFASWITNPLKSRLKVGGYLTFECRNADGTLAWKEVVKNGVTLPALDDVNNVYFGAGTQKTAWYVGLIDNAGFSALSSADTMVSHAGWTENQQYTASTRPQWSVGASSGQTITNASAMAFTMNATATIKGAFVVSNSTKGGTTGTLFATGAFASNQSLSSGQVLNVTYTETSSGS